MKLGKVFSSWLDGLETETFENHKDVGHYLELGQLCFKKAYLDEVLKPDDFMRIETFLWNSLNFVQNAKDLSTMKVGEFFADLAEIHDSHMNSIVEHLVISLQNCCTTMNISKTFSNLLRLQRNHDHSTMTYSEANLAFYFEILRHILRRESLKKQLHPYLRDLVNSFWYIACSDDGISFRVVTTHEMLPSLMRLLVDNKFRLDSLNICWAVIQEWTKFPHSFCNGITLLCSFIEFFFPDSCLDHFVLDLRENQLFFTYIQLGLLHEDFVTRKRASICLRRTVDFSFKFSNLNQVWTKYFSWSVSTSKDMINRWDLFFKLFETFNETPSHIVEPLWPEWIRFFKEESIDFSWAQLLLIRLMSHENPHLKKFAFESFLKSSKLILQRISLNHTFITGKIPSYRNILDFSYHRCIRCIRTIDTFLAMAENASLYRSTGFDVSQSPFGESLKQFLTSLLRVLSFEEKARFLSNVCQSMILHCRLPLSLVFVSEWLAEASPMPAWTDKELSSLRDLPKILPSNIKSRKLIFLNMCRAWMRLTSCSNCSLDKIIDVLCMWPQDLLDDSIDRNLRKDLTLWLKSHYGTRQLHELLLHEVSRTDSSSTIPRPDRFARLNGILLYPENQPVEEVGEDILVNNLKAIDANNLLIERIIKLGSQNRSQSKDSFENFTISERETHDWYTLELLHSLGKEFKTSLSKVFRIFIMVLEQENGLEVLMKYLMDVLFSETYDSDKDHLIVELMNFLSSALPHSIWNILHEYNRTIGTTLDKLVCGDRTKTTKIVIAWMRIALYYFHDWMIETKADSKSLVLLVMENSMSTYPEQNPSIDRAKLSELFYETKWELLDRMISYHFDRVNMNHLRLLTSLDIQTLFRNLICKTQEVFTVKCLTSYLKIVVSLMEGYLIALCRETQKTLGEFLLKDWIINQEDISLIWSMIREQSHTSSEFLNLLTIFVKIVFHRVHLIPRVFESQPNENFNDYQEKTNFERLLRDIFDQLEELSQVRFGLFTCVAQQFVNVVDESQDLACYIIKNWKEEFLRMLLHGPSRKDRKDDLTIRSLYSQILSENPTQFELSKDSSVRALIVSMMITTSDPECSLCLFYKLLEFLESSEVTLEKTSHTNSLFHRLKLRAYQGLLILLPRFFLNFVISNDDKNSILVKDSKIKIDEVLDRVFRLLLKENLLSLRYYIEWILIYILYHVRSMIDRFVVNALLDFNQRPAMVCSLLTILMNLLPNQVNHETNSDTFRFVMTWLSHVAPWLLSGHHNIRIYATACFQKLLTFQKGLTDSLESNDFYALWQSIQLFTRNSSDFQKYLLKHEQHFLFKLFDPIHHLTLNTVFHILPSMNHVAEDEWILSEVFNLIAEMRSSRNHEVLRSIEEISHYYSPSRSELVMTTLTETIHDSLRTSFNEHLFIQDDLKEERNSELENYQRKRLPWEQLMMQADMIISRSTEKERQRNSIIVVATFIDKIPNLAGLARTCEIFNAEKLMISNLRQIEDSLFQSVSVTAEKWVPIEELKENEVIEALHTWKGEGYQLIGVEQTLQSVSLENFEFPEKCVLLLGKEKEGIPVEILPFLDFCVEIPQSGIIRSLNVHVSGAILLWEYSRQRHYLKDS